MARSWYRELKTYFFWRCAIAELLASSLYCFFATIMLFRLQVFYGSRLQNQVTTTAFVLGFLATALSHGFGIAHNAYIFPAVTFGKCLMHRTSFLKALVYFIFQMAGGIIGASIDLAFYSDRTVPITLFPNLQTSPVKGCILEGLLSLVFVLAVLSTYNEEKSRKDQAPATLIFGFAIAGSFMLGYQQTGAVLNPAIVFGICVVNNHWPNFVWIYWAGPLAGGVIAGVLQLLFLFPPKESDCENTEEESEALYKNHDKTKGAENVERNAALSYVIDSSYTQNYKNPAFDGGDLDEKK